MPDTATVEIPPGEPRSVTLPIGGMTCASCVARVEKALRAVPGVTGVAVNLATERARIETAPSVGAADLVRAVEKAGYTATLAPETSDITDEERKIQDRARSEAWAFGMAALLSIPFLAHMVGGLTGAHFFPFPAWVQLGLASVVQFGAGARFYGPAWRALRAGAGNMDLLVVLGTLAAYGLSVWLTVRPVPAAPDDLYFEAATVVITLILLGKWLETRAKHSTTAAVRALMKLRPETANVVKDGVEVEVPAEMVRAGELTFEAVQKLVDEVITVSDGEILAAVSHLIKKEKLVVEPSGAASFAAVQSGKVPVKGKTVCILSGGNINVELLKTL